MKIFLEWGINMRCINNKLKSVMIVDDEYLAREGMKKTIQWEQYGCEICGEACNGQEGIDNAKKLWPDIVITDIKMPIIDGLKMIQEIQKFLPYTKYIVITGYDEFEYARGAIKLNAVDFILKPIEEKELISAIVKTVENINIINKELSEKKEKFILSVFKGKITEENIILNDANKYGIRCGKVYVILVENEQYESLIEKREIKKLYYTNICIRKMFEENLNHIVFITDIEEKEIIILYNGNFNLNVNQLKLIQRRLLKESGLCTTIGISNCKSISKAYSAFLEAEVSVRNKLYMGKGSIILYNDTATAKADIKKLLSIEKKNLFSKMQALDMPNIDKQLKYIYFDVFNKNKILENDVKQFTIEVILNVAHIISGYSMDLEIIAGENFNVYESVAKLNTINEIYNLVKGIISVALNSVKEINILASESGIKDAVEYVKLHYHEDISLKDVANSVYLSESYLSRGIKKLLGINFVEYLTKLRVEKAMEYMKDPNIKVTDIAQKVGYSDYRYFTHIFKKQTGYTPSKWRQIKN